MNITSDDPRLTAYALDELDPAGRRLMENEMQLSPAGRLLSGEIAALAARLRAALATEPVAELASNQERAIESRLRQTRHWPSRWWIPLGAHWLLKTGMTILAVLLFWFVPIPGWLADPIARLSANATAGMVFGMLQAMGTPVARHGLTLVLPHVTVMFAVLCAPSYSITILLAASLLAGNLYLRSRRSRVVLTAFVLPLVILANALRGFTLVQLLMHRGNDEAESPIVHHLQSIFFLLSLVALLSLLIWLRRAETKVGPRGNPKSEGWNPTGD